MKYGFAPLGYVGCHSERSEESLISSGAIRTENSQRCFASLNMTAVYAGFYGIKFANQRFLFLQLRHRLVDVRATEIVDRQALHDFPFAALRRMGKPEINPFSTP